ncbi:glutamate cyclase domain-containing protein [Noviherbaspirillum pedocola]|uniref:DUF4392 domain-containing protein n=1 Tax=Noviherbaspirillum pedocola TaxID=2801341 RepID=A0A934SXN1_9BURK|nr:glutamate cyclase domain-containing protein [Noviherbaspirillum pedocola]MBK4736941.1 DUF4392 domain-containing protein [Noviherbaspirillum pedocola]
MLRLTNRVTTTSSHERSPRSGIHRAGSRASRYEAWNGTTAFRAGYASSARFASGVKTSTRRFSSDSNARVLQGERKLDSVYDNIAHHKGDSPYEPTKSDPASATHIYKETSKKFEAIDGMLLDALNLKRAEGAGNLFKRAEGAGNLLTSFHSISNSEKVFLCTGSNCTDGKPQLDGPLGTALLAHSLYELHKVPIVLADRTNTALVRELLGKLNPTAAEYIRYVEINAVNGMLVKAIGGLIDTHSPDAVVHIGTPGRTVKGLYHDADGNYVGEYNMAIDQAMNLANALGIMTIALGHSATQAGMKGIEVKPTNTDKHAGLRASHQVISQSATSGALALGSLLVAAYKEVSLCTPKKVKEMLEAGKRARSSDAFVAKPVAGLRGDNSAPISRKNSAAFLKKEDERLANATKIFGELQSIIREERMLWPQTIEEQYLYGPRQRYVFAVDSSDGVLVAAKPFAERVRARSRFVLNMLLVADHAKAPYGELDDATRDERVYSMMRYTIKQGKERVFVVMMCNTACLADLDRIKKRIVDELNMEAGERGVELDIHIIDLIENTAGAIVARGGHKVVLLSTEATAKNERYPEEIRKAAAEKGVLPPTVIRIGCGEKNNPAMKEKDWASLVNAGIYKVDLNSPTGMMLEFEVNRYVDQIPLDSTAVFLCCTHFPALRHMVDARLKERLKRAGMTHTIPVFDPMEDQADALIEKLYEVGKDERSAYSSMPQFTIHTTGSETKVRISAMNHGLDQAVVQNVDFDAGISKKREHASASPAGNKNAAAAPPEKPLPVGTEARDS